MPNIRGPVWEGKLQQLVHNEKLSHYAAAKKLNVDIATVKKYAKKAANPVSPVTIDNSELLSEKQLQWLQLQAKYPGLCKTQLRKAEPALYAWLYRHARKWLHENSPLK
ncbi:MAG: hypothetical protein K9L17_06660 [Clostridiales bacterium]|nr:hypothetical protein [Clostridiales bacterium]MCF8022354.1 hypothetical protein [Clostridiales bacterium]